MHQQALCNCGQRQGKAKLNGKFSFFGFVCLLTVCGGGNQSEIVFDLVIRENRFVCDSFVSFLLPLEWEIAGKERIAVANKTEFYWFGTVGGRPEIKTKLFFECFSADKARKKDSFPFLEWVENWSLPTKEATQKNRFLFFGRCFGFGWLDFV